MKLKKICSGVLVLVFFLAPIQNVFAVEKLDKETLQKEVVVKQLVAIRSYINRTFGLGIKVPLSHTEMRRSIESGVEWLIAAQEKSGHFKYEYVPYGDKYLDDDNIVRQAGALYELGEIARRDDNHIFNLKDEAEHAINHFKDISISGEAEGVSFRCIAERSAGSKCRLGATSLSVAGILGYLERYPNSIDTYGVLLESYITFILQSQKKNGGFKNVYRKGRSFQSERESPFSNGEALLALVRYYQFNQRADVKEAIDRAFTYLKDEPYDTALYLWIMAALKDMHELWQNDSYILYGKSFTDWRMHKVVRFKDTRKNYCAYTEGIVSAYSLLEGSLTEEEQNSLRTEIDFWNRKNRRLQLTQSDVYRVIEDGSGINLKVFAKPQQAIGGFLTSDLIPTQRIDFTQHCISSYLQTLVDIDTTEL